MVRDHAERADDEALRCFSLVHGSGSRASKQVIRLYSLTFDSLVLLHQAAIRHQTDRQGPQGGLVLFGTSG